MGEVVSLGIVWLLVGLVGGLEGGLEEGLELEYSLDSSTGGFHPIQGGQLVLHKGDIFCTILQSHV